MKTKNWPPRLGRPFLSAAIAAANTSGVRAIAAIAEQQNQDDDQPPIVADAATQTVVITTHKNTS